MELCDAYTDFMLSRQAMNCTPSTLEFYKYTVVKFELPKPAKKRLPVLTAEQLKQIVQAGNVRDKAIVLFMADSGLRRAEVCALNLPCCHLALEFVRYTCKTWAAGKI